jgi:hypothetical protein
MARHRRQRQQDQGLEHLAHRGFHQVLQVSVVCEWETDSETCNNLLHMYVSRKSTVTSCAGLANYFLNMFILKFWYF